MPWTIARVSVSRLLRHVGVALVAVCLVTNCGTRKSAPPPPHLSVDAGVDIRTQPRAPIVIDAHIRDAAAVRGPWRWTLTWGDRMADSGALEGGGIFTAMHAYDRIGRYAVRLRVRGIDPSADTASDTLTVLVERRETAEVFVGAGDIGECDRPYAAATAHVLDSVQGTVFAAGDNAYPDGSAADYGRCFEPTWGRHRKRTRPVPGNHDYWLGDSSGYYGYFGVAAGAPDRGYYSFELGSWHVVALNSNIAMRAGSRQEQWLRADLAQHRAQCTLAYWHHPRFSSGITHGNDPETQALWDALYEAGATVVIAGHEHNYERFAPQTPTGARDTVRGIREFVAGTGGGGSYFFGPPKANSEVRSMAHGVLALTLSDRTYHWQFLSVAGEAFADSGTAACHRGA
jgi:Calcineurin-like phosphoesterase